MHTYTIGCEFLILLFFAVLQYALLSDSKGIRNIVMVFVTQGMTQGATQKRSH